MTLLIYLHLFMLDNERNLVMWLNHSIFFTAATQSRWEFVALTLDDLEWSSVLALHCISADRVHILVSLKDKMKLMSMTSSVTDQRTFSWNSTWTSPSCPLVVCIGTIHLQNMDSEPHIRCRSAQITLAGHSTCQWGSTPGCEEKTVGFQTLQHAISCTR